MRLAELLPREHIIAPLHESTLPGAIAALLQRLSEAGAVEGGAAVASTLLGVQARDIACVGNRLALPHTRTDRVQRLTLGLGVAPVPLRADMLLPDAEPQVVLLILAPPAATAEYLQTLAAVARYFRDEPGIEALAAADSPEAVLDILRLAELRTQPRLAVRDIMMHEVETVVPGTPLRDAVDLMVRKRLRALPVVGEKHEVLGIISERDIMRALMPRIPRAGQEQEPADPVGAEAVSVRDVMTRSVLCVSEELALEEAANMMINKDVEQLPVTGDGKLVGFLTRSDLIRKLFGR